MYSIDVERKNNVHVSANYRIASLSLIFFGDKTCIKLLFQRFTMGSSNLNLKYL